MKSRKTHLCGRIEYTFIHIEIIIEKGKIMIQTKDQKTDQISMRNTRNTLGTRNHTSANQSMNGNGNQFNSDYKRKNRNIIHENSYQRGIIPNKI